MDPGFRRDDGGRRVRMAAREVRDDETGGGFAAADGLGRHTPF
jgi:hypothetical protein